MKIDPISESLRRLVKYFNEHQIPYVVVGGVSVFVFGRSRFTMDLDIILDHTKLDREDFIAYLQKNNFDANLNDLVGFDEKTHCNFFYREGMFKIDIKGIYSELDSESIEMAVTGIYNGIKLKVNHPANIIVFKISFGSEKDYEDALTVYIQNFEKIDDVFLLKKADKMKIKKEMQQFLNQVNDFLKREGVI